MEKKVREVMANLASEGYRIEFGCILYSAIKSYLINNDDVELCTQDILYELKNLQ
jgi:hypothetical protein